MYQPPYTLPEYAVSLIAEIAAALERYKIVMDGTDGVRLRKINHVKPIRVTTAIEGNTLTKELGTAVLKGVRVVPPATRSRRSKVLRYSWNVNCLP